MIEEEDFSNEELDKWLEERQKHSVIVEISNGKKTLSYTESDHQNRTYA